MTLTETEELLKEFDNLPKTIRQPTYLEICRYPRRRFEEICSRILCFYIAPKNEHGLRDLFLSSLLELLSADTISYKDEQIRVISEENAEGKRLDILIHCPTFVIGIENKITAGVYNPLEIYKNRINLYGTENIFLVILSLRKIIDKNELTILKTHDFSRLTYFELFEVVKRKIGGYLSQANSKYVTFLTDFILTLENMSDQNILNEKLADYFFDNSNRIDELNILYQKYKMRTHEFQAERISELREKMGELTQDNRWWAWEGTGLGFNKFNPNKPNIGIISHFCETRGNALGEFVISITTWNLQAWTFYEKKVLEQFPDKKKLHKENNRVHLEMDYMEGDNDELILEKLKIYFDFLANITRDE